MIIYKITNLVNNKIYVGQTTKTAQERFNKHWNEACCASRPNNYFHNALREYGKDNFKVEVLDTANSIEELNQKEIEWINKLDACNKDIGYNLQSGGKSGIKSEETRQLIREKKLQNWQDPIFAQKCRQGLTKATQAWQEKCQNNKVIVTCQQCGETFAVAPWEAKTRKYCSNECANIVNIAQATIAASKANHEKAEQKHTAFKVAAIDWTKNNTQLINSCPRNRISTTLQPLSDLALQYDIKDWRVISAAICGNSSKKELLLYLQKLL